MTSTDGICVPKYSIGARFVPIAERNVGAAPKTLGIGEVGRMDLGCESTVEGLVAPALAVVAPVAAPPPAGASVARAPVAVAAPVEALGFGAGETVGVSVLADRIV